MKIKATFGASNKEAQIGDIIYVAKEKPLKLDCGEKISNFPMAYQTYGKLNDDKSNAILLCHGLTADQYVIGEHPVTGKDGWWDHVVGSGKKIDTDKYFVICINVLGGCMGSFGPKSINEATGKPYNLDFPVITISDMVKAEKLVIESFGIKELFSVIGGSMGGMLALEWAAKYSKHLKSAIIIAATSKHSAQNIAFHEIGRQAVMADPNWKRGNYINENCFPSKGLAVARMTAHVTYLAKSTLQKKFGRDLQDKEKVTYGFDADFQVESYLRHQGVSFVDRFDANSYLYITRALDYFDLALEHKGKLANVFKDSNTKFCVISFSTDWLYPTSESKSIVHALNASAANVSFVEIESDKGHDAFLLDEPEFHATLDGFIKKVESES